MSTPAGTLNIEEYLPVVRQNGGIYTSLPVRFTGDLTVDGTTTIQAIVQTNLTATGNTILGDALTDTLTITGATSITSTSASALAVGANGATNPVLKIDASTASVATGITITGAAAAGGVAVVARSSGTDENLTIDAKGSGTVTINATATGNVVLGQAATGVSLGVTGAASTKTGTAVPATAGAVAAGAPFVMNSNLITIECTTDAPTHNRPIGSICINLGGNSTSTRMYIATSASGAWTAFTTAA